LQSIPFHVCECVLHLSFCPAHCFPNNWKIDGNYPPVGGQRNSFLVEITAEIGAPISESARAGYFLRTSPNRRSWLRPPGNAEARKTQKIKAIGGASYTSP
jgi:hypothetical protein